MKTGHFTQIPSGKPDECNRDVTTITNRAMLAIPRQPVVAFDGHGIACARRRREEVATGLRCCFYAAYVHCLHLCHASFGVVGVSLVRVGDADTACFEQHSGNGLVLTTFRGDDDSARARSRIPQHRTLSTEYHPQTSCMRAIIRLQLGHGFSRLWCCCTKCRHTTARPLCCTVVR